MIPKFDHYHENLHASYLRFEHYLAYLKNEFINGFVLAHDNARKHYFFLFEGELQSAFCILDKDQPTRIQATQASNVTKNYFVSTCICPHTFVDYFSKFNTARCVYRNISTKQVPSEKLFAKFETDRFTGFIEKKSPDMPSKKSYLYFNTGRMIGGLNVDKADGYIEKALDDEKAGEKINGTVFSIYALAARGRNPDQERAQIIACFQQIFQLLETYASASQFSTIWRTAARELSDKHEFLDPLIAWFQYKDRQVMLSGKVNIRQAVPGMNELVNLIAVRLSADTGEIEKIKHKYANLLAAYEH